MISFRVISLIVVVLLIISAIIFLESKTPDKGKPGLDLGRALKTTKVLPDAPELVNPSGYINTEGIELADYKGKKVVLIDFWTYSCINCQRTLPYLNSWYEKYKDKGLEIIGVHTPEFEFEKKRENVEAAVKKFGIKYPVILDNDYATWRAYGNRYWPRKYLVNLEGKIVYDHIGEGAYEETETKIQELLSLSADLAKPTGVAQVDSTKLRSPETYFGSLRNNSQILSLPKNLKLNELYLVGDWEIKGEYAQNKSANAKIIYRYISKEVYLVANSQTSVKVKVWRDGKLVGNERGEDVESDGTVTIKEDRLYKIIQDANYGQHTLELEILSPGLKAFTFTFG